MHKFALFFKNLIFPYFQSIEPITRPIEIAIKILFWICLARSIKCNFRSIESVFRSIKNRSESFLKTWVFHVFFTIQNFSKSSFSLSLTDPDSKPIFLSFSLKFSSRFLSSSTGKTILPFLFWFNLIFHALKGKISNLWDFGVFGVFNDFFQNWSMGFYCWMILTRSLWLIWWIGNNWNL